ncbi:MAG: hypothetical protein KGO82_02855 [Bacteroidota bacterium]|nr:hypothetical protein [Bacteroidota bacterium]
MKFLIVFIAASCCFLAGFSQTNPSAATKSDLMQRSRHLRTTGWIFVSTGSAVTIAGTAILINSLSTDFTGNYKSQSALGGVLIGAGVLTIAGSIPFFIQAHQQHKKALSIAAANYGLPVIVQSATRQPFYPALRLQWQF